MNRVVLALVGGLVFAGSAWLLSMSGGAALGGTELTRVFGFVGLALATVLLMRVVAAIIRDGYN